MVQGFDPFEFGEVGGVFANAFADADLLDYAWCRSDSDFDPGAAVELCDYSGALLGVVLEAEVETHLDFTVIVVLEDRWCRCDGHCTWSCRG